MKAIKRELKRKAKVKKIALANNRKSLWMLEQAIFKTNK